MTGDAILLKARRGTLIDVARGRRLKIVNTYGSQVLDTWAIAAADPAEHMSMEHTRSYISKLTPAAGDPLVTDRYRPILRLVEDTSPGVHDTLMCSCSKEIYARMGVVGYHDNCEDNLHETLRAHGLALPHTPCPLNLFMNYPVTEGRITREPPVTRPGDHVVLEAMMDARVIISCCPQDLTPINGVARRPTDAHALIL